MHGSFFLVGVILANKVLVGIVIIILLSIVGAIAIQYLLPKSLDDCIEVLETKGFTVASAHWDKTYDLISGFGEEENVSYLEVDTLDQFVDFADAAYAFYLADHLEADFTIWSDKVHNILFFYIYDVEWPEGSYLHLGLVDDIDASIVYFKPKVEVQI